MRRNPAKIPALLLLGVFAFFYCGNTLFLHTHIIEGNKIVHSHPYLPSGTHSHSSQALESIAGFNTALLSMQAADEIHCETAPRQISEITCSCTTTQLSAVDIPGASPRAPPAVV